MYLCSVTEKGIMGNSHLWSFTGPLGSSRGCVERKLLHTLSVSGPRLLRSWHCASEHPFSFIDRGLTTSSLLSSEVSQLFSQQNMQLYITMWFFFLCSITLILWMCIHVWTCVHLDALTHGGQKATLNVLLWGLFTFFFVLFRFEIGSHYGALGGLELSV